MALSRRVRSISPSSPRALTALAKQMQAEGIDVISFAGGEPDFDTPKHAREAGVQAIREGFTRYTAVAGTEQLRDAVVAKLKRDNGLEYARDEVIASAGSKQVLYNLAMVLFDKRDEIIIPVPYWVTYPEQVRLAAATPVCVSTAAGEGTRAEFERRRPHLLEHLGRIPGVTCVPPQGAFYAFPNVSAFYGKRTGPRGRKINSSTDLVGYLIREARVTAVPGADFGSDKHLRLSYCLSMEQIREGLERMGRALEQLR